MRRKDRECHEPAFFEHVFNTAMEIFLCLHDGEYPYCIPLNFARRDSVIYIHSALAGRKLDLISRNGKASFSLVCDTGIDREQATTYYKSVCGRALATVLEDREEKRMALALLGERYRAACKTPAPDSDVNRVAIIRLDIIEMTGKCSLPKDDGASEVA